LHRSVGTIGPLSLFGATGTTSGDGVTVTFEHDGMQVVALLCSPLPGLAADRYSLGRAELLVLVDSSPEFVPRLARRRRRSAAIVSEFVVAQPSIRLQLVGRVRRYRALGAELFVVPSAAERSDGGAIRSHCAASR